MKRAHFSLLALVIAGPALAATPNGGDMNKAFSTAFGHPAPFATTTGADATQKMIKPGSRITYTPAGLVTVAPGLVALISKGKLADFSCDGCSTLAIHYLKQDGTRLSPVKAWTAFGGYGPNAGYTARPNLDVLPAILASHQENAPDCNATVGQIIALTPTGPVLRSHFYTAVDYHPDSNPDHSPPFHETGKLIPGKRGENFVMQYAGTWPLRVEYQRKGETYAAKSFEEPGC